VKRRTLALAMVWLYLTVTLVACSTTATIMTTAIAPTIAATRGVPLSPTLPPTPATATPAIVGSATAVTPPATATRSSAATATRGVATPSPTLQPRGTIPAGWKIYQGTLGFAIAYPSDWRVDDKSATGLVYFYAPVPTQTTFLVIATTGKPEPNANLDVLRNTWYQSRTRTCADYAIERTAQEQFAEIEFATVGATCDIQQQLAFSYTGIGLRQQVPWIFELNAPYASYDVAFAQSFKPMLDSLNISDTPQR
jgi:hypothetical protein